MTHAVVTFVGDSHSVEMGVHRLRPFCEMRDQTLVLCVELSRRWPHSIFVLFYRVLQGLTIDVIGTCAFGLDPHFQKNTDDPFIVRCRRLFADFGKRPVLVVMGGKFSDSLCNHR